MSLRTKQIMTKTTEKKKKTVLRRVTGIIGYVLIFAIAALFVFVISFKANNRTMFIFGRAAVWVMTPSMEPTIPERSYILIKEIKNKNISEIEVGDVIMFSSEDPELNGANNTHRVVEIKGDREEFITKGDANLLQDSTPVKPENVRGIYVKNLPVLTAIGRFLFSGIGMVITMTLVFVIIMIIYLPDLIRATRNKSNELEQKKQQQIEELVREEVERLKRENEAKMNTSDMGQENTATETENTETDCPENENKEETNASAQDNADKEVE